MNFISFTQHYPDEESCKALFKRFRDDRGVTCKKCGHKDHYWQKTLDQYQCKKCGFRTTLRSGTVMEASKLPYRTWIYGIFLMTFTKKGMSALEMQRQLGLKRYEPAWAMMHKIRATMGNRDEKYLLEGVIEMDDSFFASHNSEVDNKDQKRGRGSKSKGKVLVMTKVVPILGRPKKHRKSSAFRYVKMIHVDELSSETINDKVIDSIFLESTVKTDAYKGFNNLYKVIAKHNSQVVPPDLASKALPWVHTMISNAKRGLLGVNHCINRGYLQNYLNEFCYKTNRRYFNDKLFERLMIASVETTWYNSNVYENG